MEKFGLKYRSGHPDSSYTDWYYEWFETEKERDDCFDAFNKGLQYEDSDGNYKWISYGWMIEGSLEKINH